jgi:preprotein translocase subunit YajC
MLPMMTVLFSTIIKYLIIHHQKKKEKKVGAIYSG